MHYMHYKIVVFQMTYSNALSVTFPPVLVRVSIAVKRPHDQCNSFFFFPQSDFIACAYNSIYATRAEAVDDSLGGKKERETGISTGLQDPSTLLVTGAIPKPLQYPIAYNASN